MTEVHQAWLDQVQEQAIDPLRSIVDAHHHLWEDFGLGRYLLDDFWNDTGSGHNIVRSVFVECGVGYYQDGPDYLKPVGETTFAAGIADNSRGGRQGQPEVSGIVSYADLRLPEEQLSELLAAHAEAGKGLFRGIRQALARNPEGARLSTPEEIQGPAGLYADPAFRRGVAHLGSRGLTYESWHYHTQLNEFLELARAVPDTVMILDHLGHPLGVDRWSGRRDEVYDQWCRDIAAIAGCENTVIKLGGMAMPDNGFGWHEAARPPTSDEFADAQGSWYRHALECFGAARCMFESNFPMDRMSVSYQVYWNGVKKIVAGSSESEKTALFSGTANRIYSLA